MLQKSLSPFTAILTVAAVLALATSNTACKKLNRLTQFHLNYTDTAVVKSSSGINLPFNIFTPDMSTNSAAEFEVHDTRKDLIQQIKLTNLDLKVVKPENGNFSFLKSIEIYISAGGMDETKIAWKDMVPADAGNTLSLDVSGTDLKEYIKQDKFTLRLNAVTDEFIASDCQIQVNSRFFVDATLIKH